MSAISITVTGNLTGDPDLRFTPAGVPVASFTVASNERFKDAAGQWQDGQTSFVRCNAWRQLAEHVAESLSKGDRAIVTGTLRQRDYETSGGEKRTIWEVSVTEVGAALSCATVKISKARRDGAPVPEDPWQGAGITAGPVPRLIPRPDGAPVDPADDEPPF